METSSKALLLAISLSVVAAILSTAYIFLVAKNYDFTVEAPCDPAKTACFYRDCSLEECPPNKLEYYRTFLVHAADFAACSENSCLQECLEGGGIRCEEIPCDSYAGESCTMIEDFAPPPPPEPVFWESPLPENSGALEITDDTASTTTLTDHDSQIEQNATTTLDDPEGR